ncbi:MAG TPA: hypothetical protein PLP56_06390 [Candidatus Omnitrophota bacterium]|nr:hypothetical protein [Candidatus Omnitrophota bacterium]HNQ49838.1 hypothetical protein [Candidatus Omnitrophota bacterium]HQQ06589.1 hypothetical protein [Candidatus Omnitrophota bacterium]
MKNAVVRGGDNKQFAFKEEKDNEKRKELSCGIADDPGDFWFAMFLRRFS